MTMQLSGFYRSRAIGYQQSARTCRKEAQCVTGRLRRWRLIDARNYLTAAADCDAAAAQSGWKLP